MTFAQEFEQRFIVCDLEGDGLAADALLIRAVCEAGYSDVDGECRRKGESAWQNEVGGRLRERAVGHGVDALIGADLGSRHGLILRGAAGAIEPLLLIDHHRPTGQPEGSTLISSYGAGDHEGDGKDLATAGLLCCWCPRALVAEANAKEWLWVARLSILSDLGDQAAFPELSIAKARFGGAALPNQWRSRFPKSVMFGVNTGYRPGWVTFSGRAPTGVHRIEFLARHRPQEADTAYGLWA